MKLEKNNIILRPIKTSDLLPLWEEGYQNHTDWMAFDAPYFNDTPYTKESFINDIGPTYYCDNKHRFAIVVDNQMIGTVNAYYHDQNLKKWLEVGITIFNSSYWGLGIGYQALSLWISYLFDLHPDLPRIGLTTWSKNVRMIKLAEKLNLTLEAQFRKVRFYQDTYYDSISFGILREEWFKSDAFSIKNV